MEDKTKPDRQTAREQLNEIADHWANHSGEYPNGISEGDVQELSRVLFNQLEDVIKTYVSASSLNRQEAEVRALTRFIDEDSTLLTKEAVTLLFTTPDTEFGYATDSNASISTNHSTTTEDVQQHYRTAEEKIKAAKQTVWADTFPNPDDTHDHPQILWLDTETVDRLQNQHEPGEDTFDDILTRILDKTETRRPLEEFARGYLTARQENVAQLAIEKPTLQNKTLVITAHTAAQDELPDIVAETDAVTLRGQRYNLHFEEDPYGPHDHQRITLYASDNILGMDAVALDDGLEAANAYLRELREHDVPLNSRTLA